jgi:hypothetical protein
MNEKWEYFKTGIQEKCLKLLIENREKPQLPPPKSEKIFKFNKKVVL